MADGADWSAVWRWLRWFIAGGGTFSIGLALLVLYLLGVGDVWELVGSIGSLAFGSVHLTEGVAEYRRQQVHYRADPPGLPPSSR